MATTGIQRQRFFNTQVHMSEWKNCMAGKNEDGLIVVLENLGFKSGVDFIRQHPIGERFVIDIAFLNEQIAIEVDGKHHSEKKQERMDKMRDRYLRDIGWIPIRIKDSEFFGYKASFYKSLIKMVVEERRQQWNNGQLYEIDLPNFREEDYD